MESSLTSLAYSPLSKGSARLSRAVLWAVTASLLAVVLWGRPHGSGGLALFILLNIIVVTTSRHIVQLMNPSLGKIEMFMATFVVWAALIAFVELALGLLRLLGLVPILATHLVILMTTLTIRRRAGSSHIGRADEAFKISDLFRNRIALIVFLVISAVVLRQVIFALIQPPTWWDTLAHHLPVPAHWLQTQSLDLNPAFGLFTYPYNSELYYFWFLLPFHGEFAVNFVQLVFLCLLVASVISISRNLGLSANMIVMASGLFLLSPYFLEEMIICYNEIMIVALFMAAIAFSFRYYDTGRIEHLALGAISLGIFFGSDFLSLLYAPLVVGFFVLVMILRRTPVRTAARRLSVFVAMVLMLGSFWYVRNYISEGNPFYPLTVSLFGRTVFEGPQLLSQIDRLELYLFASSLLEISGKVFGLSIALSLVFCSIAAMRAGRWIHRAFFFMPALIIAGWYFLLPTREMRYLMFVLPFGALAAGYLIENSAKREKSVLCILLVGFLMVQSAMWLPKYWHVIWVGAAIVAGIHHRRKILLKHPFERIKRLSPATMLASAIVLVCVSMLLMPKICEYRDSLRFTQHYKGSVGEAWEWIDKNTDKNRIAYTGTNKSYPLYRSDISNYVTYVDTGLSVGDVPSDDGAYYDTWICRMLSTDIDYLFVCKMDSSTYMETNVLYPIERKWADTHPELFQRAFTNDYVTIYRINKSPIAFLKFPSSNTDQ